MSNHIPSQCRNSEYDLAIVGGGISGLYCALKLLEQPDSLKELDIKNIIILEKSYRWGGRLDTDIIPIGNDDVVEIEEGAMRFTYPDKTDPKSKSNMPRVADLIKDLQMEDQVVPFFMEPQDLSGRKALPNNCNTCYFNGRFFTEWYATQNPTVWQEIFNLEGDEGGMSADSIATDIYNKVLQHNSRKLLNKFPETAQVILDQKDTDLLQEYENPEYWAFVRNEFTWKVGLQETPLYEFSMEAFLTSLGYSYGCIRMILQTSGFLFTTLPDSNVGDSLQELMTFDLIWNRLYKFKGGWSSLVKNVKNRIENEVEMKVNIGVSMISEEEKGFKLTLTQERETKTENLENDTISARYVVMAVPPKSVENISFNFNDSTDWKKIEKEICSTVNGIHLLKINLYYHDDWWNKTKNILMYGPSITDLPCGFVYPFYGKCKAAGCKGCDLCDDAPHPAALSIYCDATHAQFWGSLQRLGHPFKSPLQGARSHLLPASESVLQEAKKQLSKVFNMHRDDIPDPLLTSYKSWDGKDQSKENGPNYSKGNSYHGYAVHMWGIGTDDREVMKKATQPIKGKNLYFCNEAWSGYQSWVEGALLSTDKVVKKLLN